MCNQIPKNTCVCKTQKRLLKRQIICYDPAGNAASNTRWPPLLPHQKINQSSSTSKYGLYQQEARHFAGMTTFDVKQGNKVRCKKKMHEIAES